MLHLVFNPDANLPEVAEMTPANVNDITFAHAVPVRPGATFVFGKG